jgi:probable rRNA maturation factor
LRRRPSITVEITDAQGRRLRSQSLARWLERHAPASARGTVVIAMITDARMRNINNQFRRKDYATDVLSFPSLLPGSLGEMAIATGVLRRQAREARHSEQVEARVLALHGLLHLLGYDHETDHGEMQRAEERLRKRARLPLGLIGRAGSPRATRSV